MDQQQIEVHYLLQESLELKRIRRQYWQYWLAVSVLYWVSTTDATTFQNGSTFAWLLNMLFDEIETKSFFYRSFNLGKYLRLYDF